jgi:hypothetical protein
MSMKKTTKPDAKKPAAKKPAAKKPSAKPKRKAAGSSELVATVARLAAITQQLAETAERLAQIALPSAPAPVEASHQHTDEHVDDLEVASVREE